MEIKIWIFGLITTEETYDSGVVDAVFGIPGGLPHCSVLP